MYATRELPIADVPPAGGARPGCAHGSAVLATIHISAGTARWQQVGQHMIGPAQRMHSPKYASTQLPSGVPQPYTAQ